MSTETRACVGPRMVSEYVSYRPPTQWLLGREIRARIRAFARACSDPVIVDAATPGPVQLG